MPANTKRDFKADKELVEILKNPPKKACVIGGIIDEHPNGKEIEKAVYDPRWTAAQLAAVLAKKLGFAISGDAISKHISESCICGR